MTYRGDLICGIRRFGRRELHCIRSISVAYHADVHQKVGLGSSWLDQVVRQWEEKRCGREGGAGGGKGESLKAAMGDGETVRD